VNTFPPAPWDTPEGRVTVSWNDLVKGYLAVRGVKIVAARWERGKFVAYAVPAGTQAATSALAPSFQQKEAA